MASSFADTSSYIILFKFENIYAYELVIFFGSMCFWWFLIKYAKTLSVEKRSSAIR